MTDQAQTTFDRSHADKFDRIIGTLDGLNGVASTKPSTIRSTLPFIGAVTTFVVQSYKSADSGFIISIELVDAEGRARFVLPDKVAQAIYRQRQSLTDRSTPATRAAVRKARERAKAKKEREARSEAWRQARLAKGLPLKVGRHRETA